ncbi:MAG: histidine triad nucleotide-binding protein [Opitutales bacterium]|jgi:histidine triad (HIT) family protein
MSESTIFEKILSGEIPAKIAYQDDLAFAIHDINPQAPVHFLVIPKRPLARVGEAQETDKELLGHLLLVASQLAAEMQLGKGYRVVINNGPNGGESVPHLHVHVLGGRQMTWPPG